MSGRERDASTEQCRLDRVDQQLRMNSSGAGVIRINDAYALATGDISALLLLGGLVNDVSGSIDARAAQWLT
ncbi:hypothetical protein PAXRUDRAFT_825401 [Paxillus rubicundulus Ve08.2h10]|uniref:Uncharacterized protein n=1 Tax=Paxillus rubicundulus Ve08.2h10 TaxID=930991 RepID=A0A0D0DT95_9AGAM|nr:hypothetical protein PAXRUDRAFT_825401 [Paxillus rubicundulus Ve08.2h10]